MAYGGAGTFAYAAPELLLGHSCTSKVDVYSFGVCLWEICTGRVPTRGRLEDPAVPAECPPDILRLIRQCMQVHTPTNRPPLRFDSRPRFMLPVSVPITQTPLAHLHGARALANMRGQCMYQVAAERDTAE